MNRQAPSRRAERGRQRRGAAASSLTSLGLTVQVSEQVLPAGDVNVGKVIAQTPAAGASVAPGSAVTIVVGKADTTIVPATTTVP
ncbi:MAG: PASTA domain-containing protein [Actinobacteria bacterium]|nr:PASTA domain-containing protein [Actinomycetota bacterium]